MALAICAACFWLTALDDQEQLLKISEEVNAEPDLAAAPMRPTHGDGALLYSIIFAALTTLA